MSWWVEYCTLHDPNIGHIIVLVDSPAHQASYTLILTSLRLSNNRAAATSLSSSDCLDSESERLVDVVSEICQAPRENRWSLIDWLVFSLSCLESLQGLHSKAGMNRLTTTMTSPLNSHIVEVEYREDLELHRPLCMSFSLKALPMISNATSEIYDH